MTGDERVAEARRMCHDLASWAVLLESHPELFRNATRHTALSTIYRRVAAWVAVLRAEDSDRTGCTNIAVEALRMPQDGPEAES